MLATAWRRINVRRDHRWAAPHLSEYLEGDLPSRQLRRLEAHEELCPDCARLLDTLRALLLILPTLRLPPEVALQVANVTTERVRARIEEWA